MNKELKKQIDKIPGDEGWWKGNETAMSIAEEMLTHGIDEDTVVSWISSMYAAVAAEYGE